MDIWKKYKRHFLEAELLISVAVALIIIFYTRSIWSNSDTTSWISANKKEIYPLIASIGGTLLGFVITGVSIIIAFSESEKLRLLKESTQYKTIYDIYFSTIRYLAIATVTPIIGMIVNNGAIYILYFLIWSIIISSLRIWRCIWVLENIVEIIQKK
jgi:hypothetical protein